jgi:hypothetical protein
LLKLGIVDSLSKGPDTSYFHFGHHVPYREGHACASHEILVVQAESACSA